MGNQASTSQNSEKAMEFLNLMYSNAEISNLLMNGIEGKEYEKELRYYYLSG